MIPLESLGWNRFFEEARQRLGNKAWVPARVAVEDKHAYVLFAVEGEWSASVTGRLLHQRRSNADLPKVGDWVLVSAPQGSGVAVIQIVLPRQSKLSRKPPGRELDEQVLAANVQTVFVVQAFDQSFNRRRQERFLMMAREGGVKPVVILNKVDLCPTPEERLAEACAGAVDTSVVALSAYTGQGMDQLHPWLNPGHTVAFLGPSGVGKSSIINRLYGQDIQATIEVRERDGKGRHTTTWRELIHIPGSGMVIDTPGMREVQSGLEGGGLDETFPDVTDIAVRCHFRDCSHTVEKRCAVQQAVAEGRLTAERVRSFLKLRVELEYLAEERRKHTYLAGRRQARLLKQDAESACRPPRAD
jgi:ribosome biogenesis GTPase